MVLVDSPLSIIEALTLSPSSIHLLLLMLDPILIVLTDFVLFMLFSI